MRPVFTALRMEPVRIGSRHVDATRRRQCQVEWLHQLQTGWPHDQTLGLARCEHLDHDRAAAHTGAPALAPERRQLDGEVDRRRVERVALDEAFGHDEGVPTWTQHAAQLARRGSDVGRSAEVLEGRQREDHVERLVRELQAARVHEAHLEPVFAVSERRMRGRVVQHRGARLAAGEITLAVDVGGDDAAQAVREPEDDPLVPRADRQRLGGLVHAAGLLEEQSQHPELPDLALDVRRGIALGQDLAQNAQELRVVPVPDVAELRELPHSTVWTLKRFVPPERSDGSPAVIPILSPLCAMPKSLAARPAASSRSVVLVGSSNISPRTPQYKAQRRTTGSVGHSANTGTRGRWPEIRRATRPDSVGETIAFTWSCATASTASDAIVAESSPPFTPRSSSQRS